MKVVYKVLALLMFACALSCNDSPQTLTPSSYIKWIGEKKNGLMKQRNIKNIDINACLLPNEFLAYREWVNNKNDSYDSIAKSYKCGLTFQLQIRADKTDKAYGNLMYYNVPDPESFKARSHFLNFNIEDFLWLQSNGTTYKPVLSGFDGYDELGNRMSFQVVFIIPEYNCGNARKEFGNLILTFDDPYWDLGKINFEFEKNNLADIPKLKF